MCTVDHPTSGNQWMRIDVRGDVCEIVPWAVATTRRGHRGVRKTGRLVRAAGRRPSELERAEISLSPRPGIDLPSYDPYPPDLSLRIIAQNPRNTSLGIMLPRRLPRRHFLYQLCYLRRCHVATSACARTILRSVHVHRRPGSGWIRRCSDRREHFVERRIDPDGHDRLRHVLSRRCPGFSPWQRTEHDISVGDDPLCGCIDDGPSTTVMRLINRATVRASSLTEQHTRSGVITSRASVVMMSPLLTRSTPSST